MSTVGMPGARATTHACPGCGAPGLSRERFACRPCWARLPWEHRDRVMATWRARTRPGADSSHLLAHHHAMRDAEDWYARHPAGTTR